MRHLSYWLSVGCGIDVPRMWFHIEGLSCQIRFWFSMHVVLCRSQKLTDLVLTTPNLGLMLLTELDKAVSIRFAACPNILDCHGAETMKTVLHTCPTSLPAKYSSNFICNQGSMH